MRSFFVTCFLTLAACSSTSKVDLDEDGYSALDDCDDNNAAINPGAEEICDGLDNDCDGEDDNAPVDGTTFYLDNDGDTFGDDETAIVACNAPAKHVEIAGDCDDTKAAVNPDAQEVCDTTETDDDCDGKVNLFDDSIDMDTVTSYYPDADKDNYGDAAADPTLACKDPSTSTERFVKNNTDCDDTTPWAKPNGVEVCDGIDNDCDNTTREDGMVLSVDRSGGRQDRTATFAAGSASEPVKYETIGEETLYFCKGNHYATITTTYGIDLVGVAGPSQTTLSAASQGTVITIAGEGLVSTITGLSVEGGQASDTRKDWVSKAGGGIYCTGASDLTIIDSVIANNTSSVIGGGIYNEGCEMNITDSTIRDNEADVLGGGIANWAGNLTLTNSIVEENETDTYGGGIDHYQADTAIDTNLTLVNTRVINNDGGLYGGGIAVGGGEATCKGSAESFGIYGNTASQEGGGVFLWAGTFTSDMCDFGSDDSSLPINEPNTVLTFESMLTFDFGNDASFECDLYTCE